MAVWPKHILTARSERWRLQGVALGSGLNVAGWRPTTRTDGGGLWVGEQSFLVHGRDAVLLARAVEALLDGGVSPMVAWSYEEPFKPLGLDVLETPHDDGAFFDDGAGYETGIGLVTVVDDAALRATFITVELTDVGLRAGMRFSITHPTKGVRRYVIRSIEDDVLEIRPPLREAVTAGTALDFIDVGCLAWLANPDEFLGALDAQRGLKIVDVTAQWVEAF